MENVNLHKQKLYALIIALAAFISLLLNWSVPKGYGGVQGQNGFASWGYLSLVGILGVIAASFLGDKLRAYEGNIKHLALGSFGAIAAGSVVFLIRIMTGSQSGYGFTVKNSDLVKPGLGLFICLVAGIVGLAWVSGILSKMGNVPITAATSSVPMPPSATPPPQKHTSPPPPPPPPPPSA